MISWRIETSWDLELRKRYRKSLPVGAFGLKLVKSWMSKWLQIVSLQPCKLNTEKAWKWCLIRSKQTSKIWLMNKILISDPNLPRNKLNLISSLNITSLKSIVSWFLPKLNTKIERNTKKCKERQSLKEKRLRMHNLFWMMVMKEKSNTRRHVINYRMKLENRSFKDKEISLTYSIKLIIRLS